MERTPSVTLSARPVYTGATPLHALPFVDRARVPWPNWQVPPTADYGEACLRGREYAAHFALYLQARPDQVGSNLLGLIARAMDPADASDAKGYAVGFFSYLESLIVFAAQRTDAWAWMEHCNRRQIDVVSGREVA